jgi:outer membrane protein assembly factor BamD (BamD/ComL family)
MRFRVLVLALLGACAGTPTVTQDPETVLAEAERRLVADDYAGADELLASLDVDSLSKPLRPRHALALARARAGLGELWDAFEAIRRFADDHPHSELRDQVVDLQYRIGSTLARSDRGFLFFWSDRNGGRTCLEHLITRYPETTHLADALRILGELAFEDGDMEDAKNRYRELMRQRPESEWVPLARFRYAMCIVASLRGPEYDLDQMQHATKELNDFLANPPENPEFLREATDARDRLLRWQAERHVLVADFYARIGNRAGEVEHLRKAVAPEFAATDASAAARKRLQAFGEGAAEQGR